MIKHFLGYLLVQLIAFSSFSQSSVPSYTPSDQGSSVAFTIRNFGFNTAGTFTGLQGAIVFDPQNPAGSTFDVSVDAASVNTDNNLRDNHLKEESYFDVKNYPRIRFVSTSVSAPDKSGHYTVTGKLTIRNTTKEISFPFLATPMGNDYIFKGEFSLNRKDFGIGGSSTVSNSLTVTLTILAKRS